MKTKSNFQEWAHDFHEFSLTEAQAPSAKSSEKVLGLVHAELNPTAAKVFTKVALVHLVMGTLTLLVCPQFGIGFLPGMGLMAIFMNYGHVACSVACGAFYIGTSVFAAALVLRPEEIRVIKRTRLLQIPLLGLLSMAVFACFGADFVGGLFATWLAGSLVGGLATLELGLLFRAALRAAQLSH